jgi:hypothetical protein
LLRRGDVLLFQRCNLIDDQEGFHPERLGMTRITRRVIKLRASCFSD